MQISKKIIIEDKDGNNIYPATMTDMVSRPTGTNLEEYLTDITLNVKDFGAKGDNSTDDTTSIQNAINEAIKLGCKLLIPKGQYVCNGALLINGYLQIECQGKLIYKGEGNFITIETTWLRHCIINGLHVVGTNKKGIGVLVKRGGWGACAYLTNFRIEKFNVGLFLVMAFNNNYLCGNIESCNIGIKSDVSLDGTYPADRDVFANVNTFANVLIDQCTLCADLTGIITVKFLSCTFQSAKTGVSYYAEERQQPSGSRTFTKAYRIIFDTCWFENITEQVFSNYKFENGVRTEIKSGSPFTPIVMNCNFPVNTGSIYDKTDGYGFDIDPSSDIITDLPPSTTRPLDYLFKQKKYTKDMMWVYDTENNVNAKIYEMGTKGSVFRTRLNSLRFIDYKGAVSAEKNSAKVTFEATNIGSGSPGGNNINDRIGTLCFVTVTVMCYNSGVGKQTFLLSNSHWSNKSVYIKPITELEAHSFAGVEPLQITVDKDDNSYVQKVNVSATANGIIKLQVDVTFIPLGPSVQSNQNTLYGEL